jgi:hypothetical protein
MKHVMVMGAAVALVVVSCHAWAADELKSGPQVGQSTGGPFNPLNVTGSDAGGKTCQV